MCHAQTITMFLSKPHSFFVRQGRLIQPAGRIHEPSQEMNRVTPHRACLYPQLISVTFALDAQQL